MYYKTIKVKDINERKLKIKSYGESIHSDISYYTAKTVKRQMFNCHDIF